MAMPKFVTANFELGHVWFQNRVARHVPEDARVFAAALQPRNDFRGANVFHKIRFVPTLAHALSLSEIVRCAVVAIRELKVKIIHQTKIAEYLEHERKARDRQQSRGFRTTVVMPMHNIERAGKETPFAPFNLVLARAFTEKRVAIPTQADENLLEEILSRRQRFAWRNFENHSIHVHVAGEIQIHAAAFDLRPGVYI